jgi:hypothetical protein
MRSNRKQDKLALAAAIDRERNALARAEATISIKSLEKRLPNVAGDDGQFPDPAKL